MKRTFTLLTLALALFAAAPASANELDERAEWLVILNMFDTACDSLGYGFKGAMINALSPIPREIHQAALDRVGQFVTEVGFAKFCEVAKDRIAANHQWKFQAR